MSRPVYRDDQLRGFTENPVVPPDHNADFPCPFFDIFHNNGGNKSIRTMINFDTTQFETIWNDLQGFGVCVYNMSHG